MNNNLFNVLNLYLNRENDNKLLNIVINKENDHILFEINMDMNDVNATKMLLDNDTFFNNLEEILKRFKEDKIVINEKKVSNYYVFTLNNGRSLKLINFDNKEINDVRNYLYNIKFNTSEIRIDFEDETDIVSNYQLQPSYGFINFKSIILISIVLLVVLLVSLFFFKSMM